MHVALAAGARDGLGLERQHREIIGEPAPARNRVEAPHQLGVLRGDAGRVAALVVIVIGAGARADLAIVLVEMRGVVAKRDQCRGADRGGVGAERQSLRHVGAVADAT